MARCAAVDRNTHRRRWFDYHPMKTMCATINQTGMQSDMHTASPVPETVHSLLARLRAGDVRALARAISFVENQAPEANALLALCHPFTGAATRIGFTGSPGAGKSTLVDQLARRQRDAGKTVGIVAVDPTSPYSGGAILGDRIRMNGHFADAGIYIRSMATRGFLGGLAKTTADVCTVMEAAGKQSVLIETVGTGQDEVDIVRLADITVVVLVPGMGDDVQSIKAGIMEIADIFVINKSDHEGADRVEQEIRAMQSLAMEHAEWVPPVVRTVASTGEGIDQLMVQIARFEAHLQEGGRLRERRAATWRARMVEMLRQQVMHAVAGRSLGADELDQYAVDIAAGAENPYELVPRLLGDVLRVGVQTQLRVDHLGIAVKSIAAARGFYELLGLHVSHEETVEHEQVRTAMLQLGESRIELLEPTAADSTIGKYLAKRGEGLHHLAVHVPDIEMTLAKLKAEGVRLVQDAIRVGAGGHRYFFVHPASAGGVLVEVVGDAAVRKDVEA